MTMWQAVQRNAWRFAAHGGCIFNEPLGLADLLISHSAWHVIMKDSLRGQLLPCETCWQTVLAARWDFDQFYGISHLGSWINATTFKACIYIYILRIYIYIYVIIYLSIYFIPWLSSGQFYKALSGDLPMKKGFGCSGKTYSWYGFDMSISQALKNYKKLINSGIPLQEQDQVFLGG